MASYEDLQEALARFGNAQEKYWLDLERKARQILEGLERYLGKSGEVTKFQDSVVPYVALGEIIGDDFQPISSPSKLPAFDTTLDFAIRVIVEKSTSSITKVGIVILVEMSKENGELKLEIGERGSLRQLAVPEEFNDRHQTQLFDAIADIILDRLSVSKFE